jgi:mating pheromone alpha-factor
MRFNAVIAAYILAATVSGAALPVAEESTDIAAPEAPIEESAPAEFDDSEDYDFDFEEFSKRDADPEAGWTTRPWRPVGLPVGKRDAEAEAEAGWTS